MEWAHCCITEDEKEIRVSPESFSSGFAYEEGDEDVVDASYPITCGKDMSIVVQSSEQRIHPSIQQYYGVDSRGFPRYQATIGLLFSFLAMPHDFAIPDSLRYEFYPFFPCHMLLLY